MFRAVARIATRHPWLVILGWVVVSIVIVATAPKLSATSDQSEFLPEHYESIKAATLQEKAFPTQSAPAAILVFDRKDGKALTEADSADVKSVVDGLHPGNRLALPGHRCTTAGGEQARADRRCGHGPGQERL